MAVRAIPATPRSADRATNAFLDAIKERSEFAAGERAAGRIALLDTTATNVMIIAKINEIINRMQMQP